MANKSIEIKVPVLPESVVDATIATWHKKVGDIVHRDENIVDLETDKVVLEVPSPVDGIVQEIFFKTGDIVTATALLARITLTDQAAPLTQIVTSTSANSPAMGPAVRRLIAEHACNQEQIAALEKDGRVNKADVVAFIETEHQPTQLSEVKNKDVGFREERRVPMTRLRAKIAERLMQSQHNAAILTTFNEVNLKAIMDLREHYKDKFEKKHGVKLGLMSFFTKAVIEALKRFPAVNASIDGTDIIYHNYYDIGIAVSSERGLVVPVLRNVDHATMADIEKNILDLAVRAKQGKLTIEDMQGGTFTITNGGVFGSLLATPIINPPQVGILGMHKIEERPIVEQGSIVIRPMMYLALSYDHRLIDGKDSVQFLVNIKEMLEDPARILLNI
ncbi:MAG: dihydrolipoamide succinyltransferase [Legionellales bacterium RIFCSPHIGHO2_12_FULL_42_9]|nr:MAG: dihydrolipoamide succinyltransferase [Legionellales bacterium RIFCSPHIGHO2_12_FULL_42_9]